MELPGQGNEIWVWRKSSFSGGANNSCVEVAHATDIVGVRDSKNAEGPKLAFDRANWLGFLDELAR